MLCVTYLQEMCQKGASGLRLVPQFYNIPETEREISNTFKRLKYLYNSIETFEVSR